MSKESRKLTAQITKLKEILNDALNELELLEIAGASATVRKGINVVEEMEEANENERR